MQEEFSFPAIINTSFYHGSVTKVGEKSLKELTLLYEQ
jgi:hypothetical protein